MSLSRYLSLTQLWLRLKRLFRETLVQGFSWSRLDRLYAIINDWISLERTEVATKSKSGPQAGVDPVSDTKESKYRLW
jgi:hypothetical protein